ncbi:hypothetical protein SY83_14135 [Paenibacillus swuensis]|uniref:DUF1292 domain-containing protein n=1 Tax=Paenibacillus swuensis TaxID=1178515 RepID=A0A172TJR8_9BACL|nr:DUF1292 domain-containing protein [Paenibacillus swuensis]ANE47216.1 hypothetical protein SY83_14135 [Paenibacillus swuensis]
MTEFQLGDAQPTTLLRDIYGAEVILTDEQEESVVYTLLAEFALASNNYAVLQSEELKKEDDVLIFRVLIEDGKMELETIEDDDEWDNMFDIYDEMAFAATETDNEA